MKPHQLKAFLAVAELRSIRRAAKVLFISQPAITRTMRELENDLGVPLLLRSAAGIELTEYGRAFQIRAHAMVEEARRAREELKQIAGGMTGTVNIAATALAGLTLLPRALKGFRERMPMTLVHCMDGQLSNALPLLRSGRIDFVLANVGPEDTPGDLACEPLLRVPQAVAGRAGHPQGRRRSLAALQDEVWIAPDPAQISEAFASAGLPMPKRFLHVESLGVALGVVWDSDVIGLFSLVAFEQHLRHFGLRRFPLTDAMPDARVSVLMREDARLTPAAETLLKLIRDAALQVPAARK